MKGRRDFSEAHSTKIYIIYSWSIAHYFRTTITYSMWPGPRLILLDVVRCDHVPMCRCYNNRSHTTSKSSCVDEKLSESRAITVINAWSTYTILPRLFFFFLTAITTLSNAHNIVVLLQISKVVISAFHGLLIPASK